MDIKLKLNSLDEQMFKTLFENQELDRTEEKYAYRLFSNALRFMYDEYYAKKVKDESEQ